MKKNLILLLLCGAMMASCQKDNGSSGQGQKQVRIDFQVSQMSDPQTRSQASVAENALSSVALFGVSSNGDIVENYPVIQNPQAGGTTIEVSNTVASIYAVANPVEGLTNGVDNIEELQAVVADFSQAPVSPFVMGGSGVISDNVLNLSLVRAVAKVDVKGTNGFTVSSVVVANTPDKGYVFGKENITLPSSTKYVEYAEVSGSNVYVSENTIVNPTKLLVKGTYKGKETAYGITLTDNGNPLAVKRNTCYVLTVTPVTSTECSFSISIPEWNDVTADDAFIPDFGSYMAVDFHQHTGFSDGSHPITFVLNQGAVYGLDVTVNSEHGGAFGGNASEGDQEVNCPTWIGSGVLASAIKGDVNGSGDNQKMWRWQSIKEYSYPKVREFNQRNTGTLAIQGLEWNPPGHEHCSTGIITGQFENTNPNADAMAQFEYTFDNNDNDQTGGNEYGWVKSTKTGHEKSMEAAKWLQDNHRYKSWMVPAHPERQNKWQISDYRDLNDVAPDVFVAFESVPGHQAATNRGGIGNSSSYKKSYTYGGVGIQAAQVGGLWDAMLSEGRNFWLVANSDYHSHITKGDGDFYPGEYQKTHISMRDNSAQSFVDGLRSGNLFFVHGDLIDRLEFSIGTATMGQTHKTGNSSVKVRILVHDPEASNYNTYSPLVNPALDHIDLIAGDMRSKVAKGSAEYSNDTYDKVKVIARFDSKGNITDASGVTSTKWQDLGNGLKLVEYTINITGDTYFRLRGTNHGLNVSGRTDANGNPLQDVPTASVQEGAKNAFENLWFYSSPIFVRVK